MELNNTQSPRMRTHDKLCTHIYSFSWYSGSMFKFALDRMSEFEVAFRRSVFLQNCLNVSLVCDSVFDNIRCMKGNKKCGHFLQEDLIATNKFIICVTYVTLCASMIE